MKSDAELLREYVETQSEAAFTELVQRHLDLVYSAAIRLVGGDAHLAKDAAQSVFSDLARKAPGLLERRVLAGWLYKGAHFAAAKVVRAERRRRAIEQEASRMQELTRAGGEPDWNRLRELLDAAMLDLGDTDREAVLLRFFTGKSFAEIGEALEMTEDTARKRVDRALDKLHARLARRGISSTAIGLALALSHHAVSAAPAGSAAVFAGVAMSGSAATGAPGLTFAVLNFMSTSKIAVVAGAVAILGLGTAYYRSASRVRAERPTRVAASAPAQASADSAVPDLAVLSPAALRDHLKGSGFSTAATEALVRERIYARYEARRRELLEPVLRTAPWWRTAGAYFDPLNLLSSSQRKELRDLETAARNEALVLLGPAAIDRDGMIAFRYSFVSPETAVHLDALERDYKNLEAQLREDSHNFRTASDHEHARLLAEQRERDLAELLTAEEREAYDLRLSPTANRVMSRMVAFQPTETEYRAVFAAHRAMEEKTGAGATLTRVEERPEFQQQLRGALGEQRYAEWQFAGYSFVQSLAASAGDLGINGAIVRDVGALVYQTADSSHRIWSDQTMTAEQKIAAMAQLASSSRAQVVEKLGPTGADAYLKSIHWFDQIAKGSAVRLNGTHGFAVRRPPSDSPPPPTQTTESGGGWFILKSPTISRD